MSASASGVDQKKEGRKEFAAVEADVLRSDDDRLDDISPATEGPTATAEVDRDDRASGSDDDRGSDDVGGVAEAELPAVGDGGEVVKAPEVVPVPDPKPTRMARAENNVYDDVEMNPRPRSNRYADDTDDDDWRYGDDSRSNRGNWSEREDQSRSGRSLEQPDYSNRNQREGIRRYQDEDNAPDYAARPSRPGGRIDPDYSTGRYGARTRRLPEGAGFGRWIIRGGELCWIRVDGGLTCGGAITSLSAARKEALIDRIIRQHRGETVRPGRRFDNGMARRRGRSWVNEYGLRCRYDRDGFEVCDRY